MKVKNENKKNKLCPKGLDNCFCQSPTSKSINKWASKIAPDNSNPFNFHGVQVNFEDNSIPLVELK